MKKIFFSLSLSLIAAIGYFSFTNSSYKNVPGNKLKDGDIIFQTNPSGQGKAIQLATGSKYTHVGIIFIENGKPVVYHAVQPVKKSSLEDFASMGVNGSYEIKRLKERDKELDAAEISKMKKTAGAMVGKNYDILFNWSDEEIYCSEYVWKIYQRGAGIEPGPLKQMKEFNLSSKEVQDQMQRRYGKKIPLDEKMISPGDMFNCDLFETVQ